MSGVLINEKMKSMDIKKVVASLSLDLLEVLKVCCLCKNGIDGVNLYEVTQIGSPQTLGKSLRTLVDYGLIQECGSTVYSYEDIRSVVLSEYTINPERLDAIVANLLKQVYYSPYSDQMKTKGYYSMAQEVVTYIVNNSEQAEGVNYTEFSRLLFELTKMYCVYAQPESVYKPQDLTIMKALDLVQGKVEVGTLFYSRILLCQSYFFISAFYYTEGRKKLDEAAIIINKANKADNNNSLERVALNVIEGLYNENYGDILKSLASLYDAYEITVERGFEDERCLIAMFISYQLALLGCYEPAESWSSKVNIFSFPNNNVIQFFYHLGNALLLDDNYTKENELSVAEHTLTAINVDSPLLARYYYVRSRTTNQVRKSNEFYKQYAQHVSKIYCSSNAAMKIFYAQEVVRFCKQNSLLMAKHYAIEQLDCMPIISSELSYSTRLEVLGAYAEYNLEDEKYAMLADAYIEQSFDILKALKPSKEILQKLSNIFNDETIPASLLESITWYFNVLKIEALVEIVKHEKPIVLEANGYKDISKDLKERVKNLTRQFPYQRSEIEVIEAYVLSISDPYKACQKWNRIIKNASYSKELTVALSAARYSSKIGFIYQSMEYYQAVVSCKSFKDLDNEAQSILLQEYAAILQTCSSPKAGDIWEQALKLTNDSESKANICFSQAIANYEKGLYQLALMEIQLCQCFYEREGLVDEYLAKILGWEANIYCALYRFTEAREAITRGLEVCPQYYKESIGFDLNYTYAYTLAATEDYSMAREVLAKTKKLASNKKNNELVDSLYQVLRQPLSQRKQYFLRGDN